jgi:hypothetical protein
MRVKLKALKVELRQRMHAPIPEQGRWLAQVVRGYFAYHAVPTNIRSLAAIRSHVTVLFRRSLHRCGVVARRTGRLGSGSRGWWRRTFLPPRILHPWPEARFAVRHLCGGRPVTGVPTAIGHRRSNHFPGRRKTVAVVFPPPISGATRLYTPT